MSASIHQRRSKSPALRGTGLAILLLAVLQLAACGGDVPALCEATSTPIARIQGAGEASPLEGERVTVRGVVIARHRSDDPARTGLFLQSLEDDGDPTTSEGIFIATDAMAKVGDVVAVTGEVAELGEAPRTVTSLVETDFGACGEEHAPRPVAVELPPDLEPYENMLVSISGDLTVVDVYGLGRWGQLRVARGGLVFQPTELVPPGEKANEIAANNARRMILVDDGSDAEYPGRIDYLPGDLSIKSLPRMGDLVADVTGVVDRRGEDRIQARGRLTQVSQVREPRFSPPAGAITVASINLQNYFNGDGLGGGFPTARGADSAEELARQEAKLVATVLGLGMPDVIAVQELENDGFGPQSAVAQLASAINARIRTPRSTYAYVNPGLPRLGDDEIAVGILYREDKVRPYGPPATLLDAPFDDFNRPPLAQSFESVRTADRLSVIALHLKSKGCSRAEGSDRDQRDGQSCFNPRRVAAVEALLRWVADDPTGTGDPDWVMIGDFNAYTREDPIRVLTDAGWANLVERFQRPPTWSFVFRGEAGSLDHAFASPSLAAHARGARIWHINAPFAAWLDYNLEGKPGTGGNTGRLEQTLYKDSAIRSSDHDPLVVSFR